MHSAASSRSSPTVHGQPRRGTGILNNELYVGRLVWDRLKWMTHPDTGRRICRLKPRKEWVSVNVPHLRILADDLWQAAKARQAGARPARSLNDLRRPRHLFSGLTKCASCHGGFTIFDHDNLICFNARERGTCTNLQRINRTELEARVLASMRERLMNPTAYEAFRVGFAEEMARLRSLYTEHRSGHQQELARVERRIREIVAAIADGFRSDALRQELAALESRKAVLASQVEPPPAVTTPPANLAHVFRATIAALADSLSNAAWREGVQQKLCAYIDRIVIPPDGLLRVAGNPAAIFGFESGGMVGCGGVQPAVLAAVDRGGVSPLSRPICWRQVVTQADLRPTQSMTL
jgi:site-specific DNA recombinase